MATLTVAIFLINLFFLFLRGLLTVSAGANISKSIKQIQPIIKMLNFEILIFNIMYGKTIKHIVEDIKHCQLFLACIPNPKYLIMLKNSKVRMTSFKIFKIIAKKSIMTNFVIVKYIPSNPYFNFSKSSPSYVSYLDKKFTILLITTVFKVYLLC